jgi:sugar lactone lactonase YvrE
MLIVLVAALARAEELWVAEPFTAVGSFTPEIEGPAVDRGGNVFAVSFARKPTIGRVAPDGRAEVFLEFSNGSLGNGIRFDRRGRMYVADYALHNVLLVDPRT